MKRAEILHGVKCKFWSTMPPEEQEQLLAKLRAMEETQGRYATAGDLGSANREILVMYDANDTFIGAAVITKLPAVDILIDTSEPRVFYERLAYLQARTEGVMMANGESEYLAVIPLDGNEGYKSLISEAFDKEVLPPDKFAVYRRAI